MSLLTEIEPLKQTALAELKAAADLAALDHAKGAWIDPSGGTARYGIGKFPPGEPPGGG